MKTLPQKIFILNSKIKAYRKPFDKIRLNTEFLFIISLLILSLSCSQKNYENLNPPAGTTFAIHGAVSGLSPGDVLVLQNNGVDYVTINQVDGNASYFLFSGALPDNSIYNVTVYSQPTAKNCDAINGGFGSVHSSDVYDVFVNCVSGPFSLGGTMNALPSGSSVTLQYDYIAPLSNAGRQTSTIWGNAGLPVPFSTPQILWPNTTFSVIILSTSANVKCTPIANNTGIVKNANIDNLSLNCKVCPNGAGNTPPICTGTSVPATVCNPACP